MKPDEIKTIFGYNYWAFERVWDCIAQLSDEQYVQEVDYSTGSIRNIVVHLMSSTQRWIPRIEGEELPPRLSFEDFDTLTITRSKWEQLRTETLDYLNTLNEVQLGETVHWELPNRGLKMDSPRWEILLHVANHGTDHRAQILGILHQYFHVKTVEQDMLFYLVERNQQ
jgi:uncharacterized damage-inducible protein DinB